MLKSKLEFRVAWDTPKGKLDWYSTSFTTYGIDIGGPIDLAENNPSKNISTKWLNKKGPRKWKNITASQNQAMQSMFLIWASLGKAQGDAINFYNKALFLPSYNSLGYVSSLTGVKKPIGAKYPILIDFDSIGFCSKLLAYKSYANKGNTLFSKTYRQHLIQSSATITANFLTRQDKLYLNPLDFNFYYVDTNEKYTGIVPDEQIFRPFTSNYQVSKQQILRLWNDFKYFGSNLMLPKFLANDEKKQNYLNSLVNENEELISVEQLNYETTNKDDLTRLVLQETLGAYYDGNNNLTFNFNDNVYGIDIKNEQFLDSNGNIIPYIAKYDTNNRLESILLFKEYKSIIKETFTNSDVLIQQHIANVLKNDLDVSLLTAPSWNSYNDIDKNGNPYVWYGNKINVYYENVEETKSVNLTYKEILDYASFVKEDNIKDCSTLQLVCNHIVKNFNGAETNINYSLNNVYLRGIGSGETNIKVNVSRGYCNQTIDLKIRKFNDVLTLYNNIIFFNNGSSVSVSVYFWNWTANEYEPSPYSVTYSSFTELINCSNGSDDSWKNAIAKLVIRNIMLINSNKSASSVKLEGIYEFRSNGSTRRIGQGTLYNPNNICYSGESIYGYKDGSFSAQYNSNKELDKTYYFRDIILEIFGGIYTCLEGLDKSNADYSSIQTYFRELDYQEGEEYDTVTIQPLFTINGVLSNGTTKLNTNELTYNKVLDKEGENTDNNGNKYNIKEVGVIYNPPQSFTFNTLDDDGNEITKTELVTESSVPRSGLYETNVKQLVKFTLPQRQLKIYVKMANYITKLKTNQISGYLVKYKDLTDNKIKVRLHNELETSFLQNTSDLDYSIVKCLPLVPLWTQTATIDWLQSKIIEVANPLSWVGNWKAVNRYNNFLGFRADMPNMQGFYQFYDKKINKYYKDALNFYLKEWEQQINGNYEDKDYNIKMKKLSKRFTNEKSLVYSKSIFKKPDDNKVHGEDYDSYRNNACSFGYHTAVRFSFTIYFNKHFRKTKLICKMGYQYLDWFYKQLNGSIGVWVEQTIYPPDRIQFSEKRLTLRFKKEKYNTEIEGNEASYYCVFKNIDGQFIFYNRAKKEKFVFDLNRYLPNWRKVYFDGINTYTYSSELVKLSAENRLGLYDISKFDIQTRNVKLPNNNIIARSLYYNTSTKINKLSFNTWSRAYNNINYACFYTPHSNDINDYKFDEVETTNFIDNFKTRNVYNYLYNILVKYTPTQIKDIYLKVFNKEIEILPLTDNIFNYEGCFDDLVISNVNLDLFNSSDESQEYKAYDFNNIPYGDIPKLDALGIAVTQSYWLNTTYDKSNLMSETIDTDTTKSIEIAVRDIIYYLLDNELPRTKYVMPIEFRDYFINYDGNSILAQIFSAYEIYQIGFINFLVSNETDNTELTLLFEKIMDISKRLVFNMDLKKGTFDYNSAWLPMPVEVYKRLPIYCKNFVASVMFQIESYNCTVIPVVDKKSGELVLTYQSMQIVTALIVMIVSLVLSCISGPQTGAGGVAFFVISIIGAVVTIISTILQLIALVLPTDRTKGLQKAIQVLNIIGTVLSVVSMFGNVNPNAMQIANMCIKSIDYALQIADKIANAIFEQERLDKNKEYNRKVDEYNQSQAEMNKFIEDYEFEAELLNQYQPLNFTAKESNLFDVMYDDMYSNFIDTPLDLLYSNIDSYYSDRGL